MDGDYFLNAGIQPSLHFEPAAMPTWKSLSSAVELNCPVEQSPGCFLNPSWVKSTEQYSQFESALSSMVSSPVVSNSAMSNDTHAIRELIGKLGNICNSGEIAPESHLQLAASYIGGGANSNNTSCYSTPLNSPPKLHLPIMDRIVKEQRLPNSVNSMPMNPTLLAVSAADPAFAERAAKFSCFGSRSFNDRTNQFGVKNAEFSRGSNPLMGGPTLPRVSSSPALKAAGSSMGIHENNNSEQTQMEMRSANGLGMVIDKKFGKLHSPSALDRTELATSNEESSVSEQIPIGDTGLKTPTDSNSRKRKSVSRGKSKEMASSQSSTKVAEAEGDSNSKRSKLTENGGNENGGTKAGEEGKGSVNGGGDEDQKQAKSNPKPPEPPKDYIHVRARRGQATDSHSLAERVRREKISERMKLLQDLVPGCNKVTGKALMLDEIINYVQSLQRQVEFLSMKLASVNSTLDFNMDGLTQKDIYQPSGSLSPSIYPLDTSASPFYGHQPQQSTLVHTNVSNAMTQCAVDTTTLCRNIGGQLPPVDAFVEGLPQFQTFCQGDLQSIVHMSIGHNPNYDTSPHPQGFPGSNQASQMKLEL